MYNKVNMEKRKEKRSDFFIKIKIKYFGHFYKEKIKR